MYIFVLYIYIFVWYVCIIYLYSICIITMHPREIISTRASNHDDTFKGHCTRKEDALSSSLWMLYLLPFGFCTAVLMPQEVMKVWLPQKFLTKIFRVCCLHNTQEGFLGPSPNKQLLLRKAKCIKCLLNDQFEQNPHIVTMDPMNR